ncbi:MAG: hypothetical protein J6N22_05550, partial [Schwartzia sp.]|nr:hypothetical protein [Schwartzia sp. (in: firmicutes)]
MTEKQFMSYLKKVKREVRRLGADLVPIDSVKFVNRANPMGLCLYPSLPRKKQITLKKSEENQRFSLLFLR